MIYLTKGEFKMEKDEPALRSCWKCNGAHNRLKKVNTLHCCFECGRYWIFNKFIDTIKTDKEFDKFFENLGLKKGESTTKIDKGYRIQQITIERE